MTGPRVGVLALQGDVREHLAVLTRLGAEAVPVRREAELDSVAGLVIPGGESSVMDKLARLFGLAEPLRARIADGMPVYGTCAGLIMLADSLQDAIAGQQTLGGLDVVVRRNAFGNQNDSFEADLAIPELGDAPVRAVFIRAPVVERVGDDVDVLARLDDGRIVAVEQGPVLATALHPEVADEKRFHERFLRRVDAVSRSRGGAILLG
ncbi:MAG: pyridoxal 5'-phosphate synthase glutaminase subunit PdxT [Microbacteriaceae bacterium]